MSEVIITVRGEHETRLAPEEAVVSVSVRRDGPDRGAVVEQVAALAGPLREDLTAQAADGAVREWSSGQMSVWAHRPWNEQGAQLPLVHTAAVEIAATFADLAALSGWLTRTAEIDGVHVDGVQWRLTRETAAATRTEVAAAAVRDAVERATAYAAALGRTAVTALEIADVGLLSQPDAGRPEMLRMAKASFAADAGGPTLELRPADVVVTAAVEARFVAR